jgi:hypothetical protein
MAVRIGALLLFVVVAIGGRLGLRRIPSAKLSHLFFEEVEVLKAAGMSNAEAIRRVARAHGKSEAAMRSRVSRYRARHPDHRSIGERAHRVVGLVDDRLHRLVDR